ncbi:hypothetical protein [Paenibacillus sp. OAS669]|uniref:hypothetical protein n=1 Tax=Paenibacillus sp. OAS669 TaxID=2663821 RepID=UPI0017898B0A|nr:hypothetical protein [Paenibacillus sp. OAS669]MBE1442907.1 hypothetical protein [Paenibacillus sp. OAS669]
MNRKKIMFIVTSVIYFEPSPLSYSKTRSRFTPEERLKQTMKTLESIRVIIPDAYIVLLELGTRDIQSKKILTIANRYIYLGGMKAVRHAVDSPHKGYGEAVGLLLAHRYIRSYPADYYYKFSGRYKLTRHFRLESWMNDGFTANISKGWMSTRLYGFSKKHYGNWRTALMKSLPSLKRGKAIEKVLPIYMGKIGKIENLGISGVIAPWNIRIEE